ncbi:sugar phosphate isomerase/epimerase [Halobacteria archaeon AArc-curdl1]|uniref:Sugar phosphate isomerase/epimerase n=1 Tax=Natronosalvus hydrolyticus TaxID=2979988 RepID=A0AAP2Z9T6_9EURY|nr:sugar phosphate isomerase/epimerase [Halobacteria archaeon AArc-curdl1]
MHTAIQLYTIRALERPLPELLEAVADTSLDGVEFAGLEGSDPAEVAATLERTGLEAVAAHAQREELEEDAEALTQTYATLGCDRIVLSWLDPEAFATHEAVEATADLLAGLGERVADAGGSFAYHNHDQEFTTLESGRDAFDVLFEHLEGEPVDIQLDAGWAVAAGRDPTALLERYGDRIDLLHLKDVDGDEPCGLGDGDLPLEACVDAARAADVEWLIYEYDNPADPAGALERDSAVMASLLE